MVCALKAVHDRHILSRDPKLSTSSPCQNGLTCAANWLVEQTAIGPMPRLTDFGHGGTVEECKRAVAGCAIASVAQLTIEHGAIHAPGDLDSESALQRELPS